MLLLQACSGGADKEQSQVSPGPDSASKITSVQNFSAGSNGFSMKLLSTSGNGTAIECDEEDQTVTLEIMNDDGSYTKIPGEQVELKCNKQGQGQVAMVIDNTGSVKTVMPEIKRGAVAVLEEVIKGQGAASITRVSTNSKICSEVESDPTKLRSTVEEQLFVGNGWTALYDGIRMGNETLIRANNNFNSKAVSVCGNMPNRGIIVFTDGNENNSGDEKSYSYDRSRFPGDYIDTSLEDLLNMNVAGITVPIYTIGMGKSVDNQILEELSSKTGGRHFTAENGKEVETAFDIISNYFNATASVCAKVAESMCGTRHIKVTTTSSSTKESEVSTYTTDILCATTDNTKTATHEIKINSSEVSTPLSGSELQASLLKEVLIPGFDNELGTRELLSVKIDFDLSSTAKIAENIETQTGDLNFTSEDSLGFSSRFRYFTFLKDSLHSQPQSKSLKENLSSISQNSLAGSLVVQSHDFYKFINVESYKMNASSNISLKLSGEAIGSLISSIGGNASVTYTWREIAEPKVKILDPNFEYIFRTLSGNKSGILSTSDVLKITKLDLSGRSIKSLEGLQFFKNLVELTLSKNQIIDLRVLSNLVHLEKLSLDDNKIVDLAPLQSLTKLSYLSLKNNSISNLDSLSKLINLKSLYISGNKISDISSISNLVNLSILSLSSNQISDISVLSNLTQLTKLYLANNSSISDFESLTKLTKLVYLNLSGLVKTNLEQIAKCISLKTVVLNGTKIQDYSLLESLKNLTHLYAKSNGLESLVGFANLKMIYLNLSNNKLADAAWSVLSSLASLQTLIADSNKFVKVGDISALTSLGSLSLKTNSINDLSGLTTSTSMKRLSLSGNQISDLSALSSLSNSLKYLYLSNNLITSLEALKNLEALIEISLGDNFELIESSVLSNLQKLKKVWAYNTKISHFGFIQSSTDLSYLNLLNTSITCPIQKEVVLLQYEGLSAKYNAVEGCEYIYDPKTTAPVAKTVLEKQELSLEQFNMFTVNAEKMTDTQETSQRVDFKAFDSVLGSRKIVSAKIVYSVKSNIINSAFQVSEEQGLSSLIQSAHGLTLSPNLGEMSIIENTVENKSEHNNAEIYTFSESDLDEYLNNPEATLPYFTTYENTVSGEYVLTEKELETINNGAVVSFDVTQSMSGALTSSSKAIHGILDGRLTGIITLETVIEEN